MDLDQDAEDFKAHAQRLQYAAGLAVTWHGEERRARARRHAAGPKPLPKPTDKARPSAEA